MRIIRTMTESSNISAPDLTQRPPRSPRCRLGGYVSLPRILDKGRAEVAGQLGEFKYGAPLDQHLINFLGIDLDGLREQLAAGKGDWAILEWLKENAKQKHTEWEIEQWSEFMLRRAPGSDAETLEFLTQRLGEFGAQTREDIQTWFDLVDLDDLVTFGGKP